MSDAVELLAVELYNSDGCAIAVSEPEASWQTDREIVREGYRQRARREIAMANVIRAGVFIFTQPA